MNVDNQVTDSNISEGTLINSGYRVPSQVHVERSFLRGPLSVDSTMPPQTIPLAAETYSTELTRLGHGRALWIPEPTNNRSVQMGDVGFINESEYRIHAHVFHHLGHWHRSGRVFSTFQYEQGSRPRDKQGRCTPELNHKPIQYHRCLEVSMITTFFLVQFIGRTPLQTRVKRMWRLGG